MALKTSFGQSQCIQDVLISSICGLSSDIIYEITLSLSISVVRLVKCCGITHQTFNSFKSSNSQ